MRRARLDPVGDLVEKLLGDADLSQANLTYANLINANLENAVLEDANLSDAIMRYTILPDGSTKDTGPLSSSIFGSRK